MEKIYSTTMTSVGGREGRVSAADGSLSFDVAPPGGKNTSATNPEQLFAAGYSACFGSALHLVMLRAKIRAESTESATVIMYDRGKQDYLLAVKIEGHIDGVSPEQTQELLEQAHQVCPYSKATRGNIEVTVKAV